MKFAIALFKFIRNIIRDNQARLNDMSDSELEEHMMDMRW